MSYEMLIILITLIITFGAQWYINSMYKRTKKIKADSRMTGCDVARKILDKNGLKNVKVLEVSGTLTDHYDPRNKTVSLSTDIYNTSTVAAVSVAAHECGHAIQDKNNYFFLRFRNSIVPVVNLSSKLGYIAIMIGLFTSLTSFLWIGIFLEFVILLFQVVTLPVEFNASSRALKQLEELEIVSKREHRLCYKMLKAAALTYVAGVATAILQIFRLLLIARSDER
ncbi:MAG: zinc metallopeptidase [Bacilli bacterium]|nr:zinc metallopeptidase [Bacilli bacterium]